MKLVAVLRYYIVTNVSIFVAYTICILMKSMSTSMVRFYIQIDHRKEYDRIQTASTKKEHAKMLGVKGLYPAMKLPYHNRVDHTFVDGMHTIKGL